MIAGGSHPSFGLAAKMLGQLAEVTISGRQVGRITEEIGQEMVEKRDLKTNQFQDKTLASAVIGVPRVAVVEMGVTTAFHLPSDGACTGFSML